MHESNPRQLLESLLDGISNQRWSGLHELFAEDAVIDYPFALPSPMRLEGREAIRGYFARMAEFPLKLQTRNLVVHETADPAVIVAQWDYDCQVTITGRAFRVANIQVSTIRNGKIVNSRDYHNHVAIADALGRLPGLVRALAAGS